MDAHARAKSVLWKRDGSSYLQRGPSWSAQPKEHPMNTGHIKMIVKLAGALTSLSLALPGIANAAPMPDIEDIPEVDEAAGGVRRRP